MIVEPLVFDHDRKTSLPGLREALNALPPAPPPLTFAEYVALSADDRDAYDQARYDFVALSLRVATPEQKVGAQILTRLIASNPRRKNSRRGLMISAPKFYGKTELAMLLARSVEHSHANRYPEYVDHGEVPVVWLEMTQNSTGRSLLAQIVRFLAPTVRLGARPNTDELRALAVDLLHRHRTKLVVVDEADKLGGAEPSSTIKALQNEASATFVLVGVNLEGGTAFGTDHGLQVRMRCDMIKLTTVDLKTREGKQLWKLWLASFDRNLPLCGHRPGLLTRNEQVLHRVTGGQLALLALVVERLIADIIEDPDRRDETVTCQRLFAVLENLRRTLPVPSDRKSTIKLGDLVGLDEAA